MGEVIYNKLVRDDIPEIIKSEGFTPVVRVLGDDERLPAILVKVVEEAEELRDSKGELFEFADVLTALKTAVKARGFTMQQIEEAEAQKQSDRGGFNEWLYLEKVVSSDDHID